MRSTWGLIDVQHPVGLVEDEDPDSVDRQHAPVDEVLKPSRRRNHDVRVGGLLCLRRERDATVHGGNLQAVRARHALELLGHLECKLAGWDEDERCRAWLVCLEKVDEREAERERLARAGR